MLSGSFFGTVLRVGGEVDWLGAGGETGTTGLTGAGVAGATGATEGAFAIVGGDFGCDLLLGSKGFASSK